MSFKEKSKKENLENRYNLDSTCDYNYCFVNFSGCKYSHANRAKWDFNKSK